MKFIFLCIFASIVIGVRASSSAWAWGNEGHEIVAIIAADNLTPAAREQVAAILGTSADVEPLAKAMAIASIRADTEFREQDRSTAAWHFIDICLQDSKSDIPARCAGGACVTAKVDEYAKRLKQGNCDKWGGDGDLAFVIHLAADFHQPLHTATDADRGGNCITVESEPHARNLHNAWDTAVVYNLEDTADSGSHEATAHKLEQMYGSGSESGAGSSARCSPWSVAFPPCPPQVLAHPCSGTSQVLFDRPTPHGRACWTSGSRPSPAGPPHLRQRASMGSPGSRAWSFHACLGS
jgi:S1/P1 Nuclease